MKGFGEVCFSLGFLVGFCLVSVFLVFFNTREKKNKLLIFHLVSEEYSSTSEHSTSGK